MGVNLLYPTYTSLSIGLSLYSHFLKCHCMFFRRGYFVHCALIDSCSPSLQTLVDFEEQYREKLSDPINNDLNLDSLVGSNDRVFPYSQQCHEATLTLAKALQLVLKGLSTKYFVVWENDNYVL